MPDFLNPNGSILLHSGSTPQTPPEEPTNPDTTTLLGLRRTDETTHPYPLADIGMFGAGTSNLQGVIALRTMNSGTPSGPLVERMRIHTDGSVGIGTQAPTAPLEVAGIVKATAFQGDGSALTGVTDASRVSKAGDTMTGALQLNSTLTVTGAATVGSLTAAANQHVTVSGTGDYKHGDRVLQLPPSAGTPVNINDGMSGHPATGATGWKYARSVLGQAQFWYGPANGQEVVFPVMLEVGDRIKSVSARIQDTSGAGNTITMYLHKSAPTTSVFSGSAQIGATQTSAASGAIQTLTLSGLTQVINSFELYNVSLRANGTSFGNHRILGVQITYDRP